MAINEMVALLSLLPPTDENATTTTVPGETVSICKYIHLHERIHINCFFNEVRWKFTTHG